MSVPSNWVQQPGVGAVSADQMNSWLQGGLNYAALRLFSAVSNMQVAVLGAVTPGDGGQGMFWWNSLSTAPDNNASVIVPFGNTQGAWIRLPVALPVGANTVRYVLTGTSDTAMASDSIIAWDSPVAADKTETLPAPTTAGQTFTVKDADGNVATYPITVTTAAGSIVGDDVIDTPFGSLTFVADGVSKWLIV